MSTIPLNEPPQIPTFNEIPAEDLSVQSRQASKISPLEQLDRVLKSNFYQPDTQAIHIILGTIQSHRLKLGDPAWLFVVAPPGSGKTSMSIMGACGLPDVVSLGDFSENTFLSGFFGHEKPGMLEKLGHTVKDGDKTYISTGDAVFVAKDFTTVLSMRREKRAAILGQLREIYDGMFRRDFGTGVTKIWRGRITIVAAVTPVIDRMYSIFSVLGERFMQLRWHRPASEEAGEWAIRQQGREGDFQQEIKGAIANVLSNAGTVPTLPATMQKRIASIAELVAIGRTHVYRNNFGSREIEYAPEPEANTRLSKALAAIVKGIGSLRGHREVSEEDIQDVFRVALDCMTDRRRRLFLAAAMRQNPSDVEMSRAVRQRELEELEELGLLVKAPPDSPYRISDRAARLWNSAGVK